MTTEEWAKCVLVLRNAYPTSFKLDATGVGTWFDLLADLPGLSVQAAVVHMARTTKAFPSVAEIRQLAEPQRGDGATAWGEFIAAVERVGYTGKPRWSDPVIGMAVESLGGWIHVCQTMLIDDLPAWRAQFRRAYEASAIRDQRDQTFQALGVSNNGRLLGSGDKAVTA